MKKLPIIFCHYGFSKYLPYVFECVKISNPEADIILLGDKSNKKVSDKFKVKHFNLEDYDYGDEIKAFDQSYQLITSSSFDSYKHGEDWNKFVFRKWFILYNFLIKHSIEKFWHFDSDNMIFIDLSKVEDRYNNIDFTEQSGGNCIKGFFGNTHSIKSYLKKINEVFLRKDFLEEVREDMRKNEYPCSFNEMSVYAIFKKEEKFQTTRLNDTINNTFFDDLICIPDGMKMQKLPLGENLKLVHLNPDGRFFCIEESTNKPIEAYLLNLSWVPLYIFKGVLNHFKKNRGKTYLEFNQNSKTLRDIHVPLKQRLKLMRKKIKNFFRGK